MDKLIKKYFILITLALVTLGGCSSKHTITEQNEWVTPSKDQLSYERRELTAFVHFGINTFTNREWGTGNEDPSQFNPTDFDPDQWARVLKENGFKELVLTAKHHDGFCLWPSKYTDHDVASSPWKNGNGDVVKEVSEACHRYGLKFGIYLSPWDMHEPTYGTDQYNKYYLNQLRELLTNYGDISQVWFDGAKGKDAKDMEYDFQAYRALVRKLQPHAVMFSDAGPDLRWVGNEDGLAGTTNWSTIDRSKITIGKPGQGPYLSSGDPEGKDWVPAVCDFSIRPGWFYHPREDSQVKSLERLFEIYYKSLGRNATVLLNIPPGKSGRFHSNDINRLQEFSSALRETFSVNVLRGASITTSSGTDHSAVNLVDGNIDTYWKAASQDSIRLDVKTKYPVYGDRFMLKEHIQSGQRINHFKIQAEVNGSWKTLGQGTTVGYQRLLRFDPVTSRHFRIYVTTWRGAPVLNEIGLFKASDKEEQALATTSATAR